MYQLPKGSCFKIYSTFACFSTNALYPGTTNKCKYYTLIPYHRRLSHYCITFAENKTILEIIEGKGGKIKVMGTMFLFLRKGIVQMSSRGMMRREEGKNVRVQKKNKSFYLYFI